MLPSICDVTATQSRRDPRELQDHKADLKQEIEFESLYWSLRVTIINAVHDAFPTGTYRDSYHPVRCILQISEATLDAIMSDNSVVWTKLSQVPKHLVEKKRANFSAVVDPEEPTQSDLVNAIKFLKQLHLPGSLLGKWQFPLPDVEVFQPPMLLSLTPSPPSTPLSSSPY
jgi:hypothetical protein